MQNVSIEQIFEMVDRGEPQYSKSTTLALGVKEMKRMSFDVGETTAITVPVALVTPLRLVVVSPEYPITLRVGGATSSDTIDVRGPLLMTLNSGTNATVTIANQGAYTGKKNRVALWVGGG